MLNEVIYASKFRHLDRKTRASKHMVKIYAIKWKKLKELTERKFCLLHKKEQMKTMTPGSLQTNRRSNHKKARQTNRQSSSL
ncbi:hypothetical protein HanPI659440_Chr12g0464891 [Helianthus annuus]|nr:hypothetical protein HanPI659440_Chr12g0464891 [Helianthus annuus]